MKIHMNTTSYAPVNVAQAALRAAKLAGEIHPDVVFDQLTSVGSRSHSAAIEVKLASLSGGRGTSHPRRPNSGGRGADGLSDVWAATYDEWGWFLARVFAADPSAKATYYADADDFHRQTKGAYRLPTTTTV